MGKQCCFPNCHGTNNIKTLVVVPNYSGSNQIVQKDAIIHRRRLWSKRLGGLVSDNNSTLYVCTRHICSGIFSPNSMSVSWKFSNYSLYLGKPDWAPSLKLDGGSKVGDSKAENKFAVTIGRLDVQP